MLIESNSVAVDISRALKICPKSIDYNLKDSFKEQEGLANKNSPVQFVPVTISIMSVGKLLRVATCEVSLFLFLNF